MDLLKQAFSELERTVEKTVTEAASAVVESASEYPKPVEPARGAKQLHLSAKATVKRLQKAGASWDDYDWQDHQAAWQVALQHLQDSSSQHHSQPDLSQQLQQLYQELLWLPDPAPALSNASELAAKAAELEASNKSLQQQVAHLQKDQSEVSQLLKEHEEEQAEHAALKVAHAALQEELSVVKSKQQSSGDLQQQVHEQQDTINSLQAALCSLRKEFEASQSSLFELMSQQEAAAGSANTAEQLAVEEIERLTADLHQLRKDKSQLQHELMQYQQQGSAAKAAEVAQATSAPGAGDPAPADALNNSSTSSSGRHQQQHDAVLAALRAELEAVQETARDRQHEVALLTTKLAAADSRLQRVTSELERRPPASAAAAMAEQLAALSALLTQQLEAEGWGQEGAAAAAAAVAIPGQLEPLLQERCRRLERSFQSAKAEASAAAASAAAKEHRLQQLQQQVEQQEQLVRHLEGELLAVSSCRDNFNLNSNPNVPADAVMLPGATAELAAAAHIEGHRDGAFADVALLQLVSDGAAAAGGVNNSATTAGTNTFAADGAPAFLAAVAAQRDRFKSRFDEMESQHAALKQQYQESQARIGTLQTDNVALIEKIRFLERYKQQVQASYGSNGSNTAVTVIRVDGAGCIVQEDDNSVYPGHQGPGSAAGAKANRYRCGPLSLDLGGGKHRNGKAHGPVAPAGRVRTRGKRQVGCFGGVGDPEDPADGVLLDPETRYRREYEARLNPFAEFQQSESELRLRGMQLHDKALLAANRLIAGSKMARAFIAVYVVLLHVFLMLLMYYSATPHAVLEEVQDRTAAGNAAGVDAVVAARLAAAGAGVGDVNATSSHSSVAALGVRLLLQAWR